MCLIVKNEEKFLGQCLASVRGVADQMVVVDTGSTDRTVEIAKEHGAEVHPFAWRNDFSAARNAGLEHATGDWVLILDADEELAPEAREKLRRHLAEEAVMAWRLPLVDAGGQAEGADYVPRLFRNAPGLHFTCRIHEQIFTSIEPQCGRWGLESRLGEARLLHHGYTTEMLRDRNKSERNLELLEVAVTEHPGDAQLWMQLGLELCRSGRRAEGLARYRRTLEIMSAVPRAQVAPELRERYLFQYCTYLRLEGQFQEVVRLLGSPLAADMGGLSASFHLCLGLSHFALRQFRQAAEQMQSCVGKRFRRSLSPEDTDIRTAVPYHCLALCLDQLGDAAAAERAFQEGIKQKGREDMLRVDYARFLVKQTRLVEALQILHGCISAQNEESLTAWRLGGEIALSRPEFLEFARDWTGEAMRYAPEDREVMAQRAEALMLSQQTEAAAEVWQRLWKNQRQPRVLAAVVLCELLAGPVRHRPQAEAEAAAASRAFIGWYRKCVAAGAAEIIARVHSRIEELRPALPQAAQLIEAVVAEANRPSRAESSLTA